METRPDGTPGSLAAYAPKPTVVEFIRREPAIMIALASRPSPWRMVNTPTDEAPAAPEAADAAWDAPDEAATRGAPMGANADTRLNTTMPDDLAAKDARPNTRGPVDLKERIFTGDALARFTSARFDPDAPVEPLSFEDEDSVVELELISTVGDPATEARRAAMIAAHPEGKPIVTFRHGVKQPPAEPPDTTREETPPDT